MVICGLKRIQTQRCALFFHPDCDRRSRDRTGSAAPEGLARGLMAPAIYRRWGVPPRPEQISRV